jgi:type II secretory pathway pseudopilin PulG
VRPASCSSRRRGFTLIDVLVLIVLVGTVAGSFTLLFGKLSAQSAMALRDRQALALAQALLAEVRSLPFTYCDGGDARVALATGAFAGGSGCAASVDLLGPEGGESRYAAANRFDGVSDYQGLQLPGPGCPGGICDIAGNLLNPPGGMLAGCQAGVAMAPQALAGIAALDANGRPQGLRIVVTVRCPGASDIVLEGLRLRHAPNRI